jgi:hypothetical protein
MMNCCWVDDSSLLCSYTFAALKKFRLGTPAAVLSERFTKKDEQKVVCGIQTLRKCSEKEFWVGCIPGTLLKINTDNFEILWEMPNVHKDGILAIRQHGEKVATGGGTKDPTVKITDISKKQIVFSYLFGSRGISSIVWDPLGARLIARDAEKLALIDTEQGKEAQSVLTKTVFENSELATLKVSFKLGLGFCGTSSGKIYSFKC